MYTPEQYVQWYNLLKDPKKSRVANENLIKLNNSPESWAIAKSLTTSPLEQLRKHGCLMLSRKLSKPFTLKDEAEHQIQDFIFSLPTLNQSLHYSIAKIHIHLGYPQIRLRAPHNSRKDFLSVLQGTLEAVCSVTLAYESKVDKFDVERSRAQKIYNSHKNLLVQSFGDPALAPIILKCIESLTNVNIKLDSPHLFRSLLTQDISEVYLVLEEILLHQKYPELNQQIFNYLSANSSNEQVEYFYPVFLAFARSLRLLSLPLDLLKSIIGKTIQIMRLQLSLNYEERASVSYISQTFMFWNQANQQILRNTNSKSRWNEEDEEDEEHSARNEQEVEQNVEVRPEYGQLIYSAFIEVWNITIERSILRQIPKFQQIKDPLDLTSVDADDNWETDDKENENNPTNRFRPDAQDFFMMCYSTPPKNEQYSTALLKSIFELASSQDQIKLELGVFVLSSVIEFVGTSSIQKISQIFAVMIGNPNCVHPYIWQQLLKLLGKFGPEATTNPAILEQSLRVIQKSIQIPQLACLACESLNSIIQACSVSSCKADQTALLDQFLDCLFASLYFSRNLSDPQSQKIFQLMTTSFILFIYYFKDPNHFSNYLGAIHQNWVKFGNQEQRCKVLEYLTLSHVFVRSSHSTKFTNILSEFCLQHLDELLSSIFECPVSSKDGLKCAISRMSVIAGNLGGYNSHKWASGLLKILQIHPKNQQILHYYVNPASKFLKIEANDQEFFNAALASFIEHAEPIVTSLMMSCDQKYYESGLSFHFQAIYRHSDKLGSSYNLNQILGFICERILKNNNFTEFTSLRMSLAILRCVIQKNYQPQLILQLVLEAYSRLADQYWKSLESILVEAYKQGGMEIYKQVFAQIKPNLLPPNPLFDLIHSAFEQSQMKTLKKLFANL